MGNFVSIPCEEFSSMEPQICQFVGCSLKKWHFVETCKIKQSSSFDNTTLFVIGSSSEELQNRNNTGPNHDHHEKSNKVRVDAWAILITFGDLAGIDVSPLGNVLVELFLSVADVSWKRLLLNSIRKTKL